MIWLCLFLLGTATAAKVIPQQEIPDVLRREDKPNIDLFFSGGGIRATFGTLIAMCEVMNYWTTTGAKGFRVHHITGLSGGAWGVSFLGGSDTLSACELVEKAKEIREWGKVHDFAPIACSSWDGPLHYSCFNGWYRDIEKWATELLGDAMRKEEGRFAPGNMVAPEGFGKHLYHDETHVFFQSDPCHFGGGTFRKASADGACLFKAVEGKIFCAPDLDIDSKAGIKEDLMTDTSHCQVGNEGRIGTTWTPLTPTKILAFSSAAWASATAVSHGAKVGTTLGSVVGSGDKTTPEMKCTDDSFTTSFCDAGGECNLPLGALDVMYAPQNPFERPPPLAQFVAFDFSDNAGDNIIAVNQCLEKWKSAKAWTLESHMITPWGYTLWMKGTEGMRQHEFILHVVLFRGIQSGDQLVKKFPTIPKLSVTPNFFTPEKAALVDREYREFLRSELFGQARHPFNTPASAFKERLLRLPKSSVLGFLEEEQKVRKRNGPDVLQPEID